MPLHPLLILALAATTLTACASRSSSYYPIIDRKNVDPAQYQRDLAECQGYAGEVDARRHIGGGAVAGAVIGGAMGAIVGNSDTAERMAGVGGVTGAARGTARTMQERQQVLRNCMTGRGYRVLN
jgi:outer membrane lipoprotein SlyB